LKTWNTPNPLKSAPSRIVAWENVWKSFTNPRTTDSFRAAEVSVVQTDAVVDIEVAGEV
jgi:hypothetical protein